MCGIAGYYSNASPERKSQALNDFARSLAHRGPDGRGLYQDDTTGLVHTRLSIIDVSEKGSQPFYNEDRTVVLVCNGEIYNYVSIRNELINKGHTFSSASDCEVILHLYEEHSGDFEAVLKQLTGMFAFALWDTKCKKLFVARDRVGIKPLYFYNKNGAFVFASEVKPIVHTGVDDFTLDYTSLYEYFLLGSIPGPNTLYTDIKALEAGHYLTISGNDCAVSQYWDIPALLRTRNSETEIADEAEALLKEVIKDHLVADVPVGSFLSAGVDSSLITSIASLYHPGIFSFTASFPGEPEDEGDIAAQIAGRLKTTHIAYNLEGDFFKDFSAQVKDIDQPFAVMSSLSLGRISKLAGQHIKVVLSGDGGDELFAGYNRHSAPVIPRFLKAVPARAHDAVLKSLHLVTRQQKFDTLRKRQALSPAAKYLNNIRISDEAFALSIFNESERGSIDTKRYVRRVEEMYDRFPQNDPINKLLYVDFKTTLVDEMLTKCDRMTMINGIEGRVPFLDHRMVEFAFSIPSDYKKKNNFGKIVLREILKKYQGADIAYRQKTGFNSPMRQWLANDAPTRSFALQSIAELKGKSLLSEKVLQEIHNNVLHYRPDFIYGLVCLNEYLKNL